MWHNVRQRFDNIGVTNVVWVMVYEAILKYDPCMTKALWPGDSYVDWVAWDPYDSGTGWNDTISFFYNQLTTLTDATHSFTAKPWMLSEHGIYGKRPQSEAYAYYDDAKTALDNGTYSRIKAYVVFDAIGSLYTQIDYGGDGSAGHPVVQDDVEQTHYKTFANDINMK
jgi:beta-mannanase